ncbi:hypothetical protein [Candidatus Methylospira mobilis]|nr:hypothetical protein [Candidatus Methylospira mobilis]
MKLEPFRKWLTDLTLRRRLERYLSHAGEASACPVDVRGTVPGLSGRCSANSSIWFSMAFAAGSAWQLERRVQAFFPLEHGVWRSLFAGCIHHPDVQSVFIDSTINRTHPCTGGAAGGNAGDEALGRSKGGFTARIVSVQSSRLHKK